MRCQHIMRGTEDLCALDEGHKGRHSGTAWTCDGCGRKLRGTPTASAPDGPEPDCGWMDFCFLCAPPYYAKLSPDLDRKRDY
jgi:hypothetical protein